MTRVPFLTAERPLKEYPGAKQEMPPADLDFAFVPGCQTSGQKGEELVCSTWASSILRTLRFHPGTKPDRRRRRKKCTRVPNFRSQLAFVRCRPPEPNLKKVPRVQTSSVIRCHPSWLVPSRPDRDGTGILDSRQASRLETLRLDASSGQARVRHLIECCIFSMAIEAYRCHRSSYIRICQT